MELRFTIPPRLLKVFEDHPRMVIKYRPDGMWPVGPELLRNPAWLGQLATDREFMRDFEVVIMPKG